MNFSARKSKKCLISWKGTRNHRFGQNYATFRANFHVFAFRWTFKEKVGKTGSFREKARKLMHFLKTCNFSKKLPCFDVSMNFRQKVPKTASFREKARQLIDLAKTMQLFVTNYHVLVFRWTFQQKVAKSGSIREKARKIIDLAKTLQIFEQNTMSLHFHQLFMKKLQKVPPFVKKHEKPSIWPKLSTFRANYHVLAFSWTFQQEVAKSASFRGKAREIIDLAKTMQLFRTNYHVFAFRSTFRENVAKSASFRETARKIIDLAKALQLLEQATMSFSFWWTFKKKVAKSASSREKARKIIDFVNLQLSEKTTMFWRFDEHCSKKLQKATRAVKKHEKSSIWPTLCNFSNKVRCFCISMNFQGKSCQKYFVSWKSTKNHRFGQHFATFRANYHVLAFRWSFQQKVAKSASFREKARKIVDLAKTRNFSNKLPCFDALVNFTAKSCRKCLVFWENSKNHRLGQNLQLFRTKYHVYAFRWTFQQKVAKSASFRERARKIIDLGKTCNFSNKLPCFGISMNFSGKKCKKWPVSWKSTNTHRFGQNLQLLEETTMFWHFDDYCRKKLQKGGKMAHFVKNDEKSSIWPKLATFRGNYHVSAFLSTFQQKVSHFVKKHEKSSFGSCLAHS